MLHFEKSCVCLIGCPYCGDAADENSGILQIESFSGKTNVTLLGGLLKFGLFLAKFDATAFERLRIGRILINGVSVFLIGVVFFFSCSTCL